MMNRTAAAFTLVELLATLAVAAAVLPPLMRGI